jgi:hypothetical protein
MASPTFVQQAGTAGVFSSITANTTGVALPAFGANVTAGNTVIVLISQANTNVRTFEVSDDSFSTTYSAGTLSVNSNRAQIFYRQNHAGGAVTCAVRCNTGTTGLTCKAIEISETSGAMIESIYGGAAADVATNGGYACGASGEIDTTDGAFIVGILVSSANTGFTVGSGYTQLASNTTRSYAQYKAASGAVTDDRCLIGNGGTARIHTGAMMAFYGPSGGGGFQSAWARNANTVIRA